MFAFARSYRQRTLAETGWRCGRKNNKFLSMCRLERQAMDKVPFTATIEL